MRIKIYLLVANLYYVRRFKMYRATLCLTLFLALPFWAQAQSAIQLSHIEANVPEATAFEVVLRRDMLAHFKAGGLATAERVDFELLREAPTQSGASYPKYYAWVKVSSRSGVLQQGAVRVAAIDKVRFEVTDFIAKSQVLQGGGTIEKVFPAALCPKIKEIAATP